MAEQDTDAVEQLNSFLRGELSAVETFRQALEKVESPQLRQQLQLCRDSHSRRAQILQDEVSRLGGQPAAASGMWGAFARLVEGGAKLFGEKAAISALEEGEDHGMKDYERDKDSLPAGARFIVESQLLPEQRRTHEIMRSLQGQA